ncbi:MAG: SCO family protein [Proteobacteria bacterium]|nr:SCO family protein [Pseudomonadota bacterium]
MRARASGLLLSMALLAGGAIAHEQPKGPPVVLAPGYSPLNYPAPLPGSYQLPPIQPAADAAYVDSRGQRGQLHDLYAGRVTILSFIYTHCDDVNGCPLASFVMGQIARRLHADPRIAPKLRLVSFSFDPARDTPAELERYAKPFRPPGVDWDFVTSPSLAALAPTLAAYQQGVQQSEGHAFAHILRVFLIDSHNRVRNIYSPAFLHADTLAADVETVLREQGDIDASGKAHDTAAAGAHVAARDDVHLGLPAHMANVGAPDTRAQVELGERLFFDRRLSLNRTLSCAMCHVPAQAFAVNDLATAVGIEGRTVKRNAPTLLNVGYLHSLFHDGRENRLEQQVWGPLLAANEMGNPSIGYVLDNLARWPEYPARFQAAFGAGPSMDNVGRALAAYQRTLVAGGSDFDRWYYGKDARAMSPAAQRGFALFRGKARCVACHAIGEKSALFTDEKLHNTGLGFLASMAPASGRRRSELAPGTAIDYDLAAVAPSSETPPNDLGRYEVSQDPDDRWKYRTPSLRNVALTRPYMHNGALSTLADVVAFYDGGGVKNDLLDPLLKPLQLTAGERQELVAFLESLTSPALKALITRAATVEVGNPAAGAP